MSPVKRINPLLAICLFLAAALMIALVARFVHRRRALSSANKGQQVSSISENQSPTGTPSEEGTNTSSEGNEQQAGDLSDNPLKGRTVFVDKGCVKCHSVWGVGGKLGPDLSRAGMGRSFLQISGMLWSHSARMIELMEQRGVARPTFTQDEMGKLVSYLYYLNYFNEPGDAIAGRTLFSEKGCGNCHSVGGIGGSIASPLDSYQEYASPLFLAQGMWNQGPQMAVSFRAHGMISPGLKGKEIADLAAYVRGQALGSSHGQKLMRPGNPIMGQQLFNDKGCVRCHSIYAKGGKVGPDLARKDLFESAAEIAGAMWNHGPQMWAKMQQTGIPKPSFSANEMADVISYLYFVRYTDEAGDVANGERLFNQRGCAECHTIGQGEKIGPDLATSRAVTSSVSLTAAMWNHAPIMEKLTQAKGLPWPKFESDEMRDLVEYLKLSAGHPTQPTKQ
jgi:cytochrome c2